MDSTTKLSKLCDVKTLQRENVRMKNTAVVEAIIEKLQNGGKKKLQVILDFDRTLTKPFVDGKECLSSYGIFNLCPGVPKSFIDESLALLSHYRPLEIDSGLTKEEKSFYSEEWTKKKAKLLNFDLDPKNIDVAVERSNVVLRDGTDKFLQSLSDENVPVLVFSGGLWDTVTRVLKHQGVLHPNVHVIANTLKFNGNKLDGLQGEIIHAFNKNEKALKNTTYFHDLDDKTNAILLGDSVGDADMADGVKDLNAVLKIGFLQDHVEESLTEYMDHFDIVLINDMSMDVVNEIFEVINQWKRT